MTPAKEVNFCCRYRPSVEVAIEKLVQAVTCIVRCRAVVFHPVIKQGHAGLEVRVIESVVRAGIDNELDWRPVVAPQLAILLEQSAAGVQSSRAPTKMSMGIPGRAMACLHGG
jgi:hypothetical protein